jgi:hypothetical protein
MDEALQLCISHRDGEIALRVRVVMKTIAIVSEIAKLLQVCYRHNRISGIRLRLAPVDEVSEEISGRIISRISDSAEIFQHWPDIHGDVPQVTGRSVL